MRHERLASHRFKLSKVVNTHLKPQLEQVVDENPKLRFPTYLRTATFASATGTYRWESFIKRIIFCHLIGRVGNAQVGSVTFAQARKFDVWQIT